MRACMRPRAQRIRTARTAPRRPAAPRRAREQEREREREREREIAIGPRPSHSRPRPSRALLCTSQPTNQPTNAAARANPAVGAIGRPAVSLVPSIPHLTRRRGGKIALGRRAPEPPRARSRSATTQQGRHRSCVASAGLSPSRRQPSAQEAARAACRLRTTAAAQVLVGVRPSPRFHVVWPPVRRAA
eukprot:scaffold1007_cov364-Prasinococcus_capsulatus_cf.AAC.5